MVARQEKLLDFKSQEDPSLKKYECLYNFCVNLSSRHGDISLGRFGLPVVLNQEAGDHHTVYVFSNATAIWQVMQVLRYFSHPHRA